VGTFTTDADPTPRAFAARASAALDAAVTGLLVADKWNPKDESMKAAVVAELREIRSAALRLERALQRVVQVEPVTGPPKNGEPPNQGTAAYNPMHVTYQCLGCRHQIRRPESFAIVRCKVCKNEMGLIL